MSINQDPKPEWLKRVRETYKFHKDKCLQHNGKWSIADTAKELKRSVGSVSQEITVAQWLKTHSAQLEKFDYFHEAINYIRDRKHHLLMETDLD